MHHAFDIPCGALLEEESLLLVCPCETPPEAASRQLMGETRQESQLQSAHVLVLRHDTIYKHKDQIENNTECVCDEMMAEKEFASQQCVLTSGLMNIQ
jgi:hypothetical protein